MSRPMERCHSYFYPRPPRGGRRGKKMVGVASNKFLSTPSARRATGKPRPWRRHKKFSIHALREEGDAINLDLAKFVLHFYPRPPRGGRLVAASAFTPLSNFYPRPPRGGRQKTPRLWYTRGDISIHALREEGDIASPASRRRMCRFLSTPSARRATLHSGCTGCPG